MLTFEDVLPYLQAELPELFAANPDPVVGVAGEVLRHVFAPALAAALAGPVEPPAAHRLLAVLETLLREGDWFTCDEVELRVLWALPRDRDGRAMLGPTTQLWAMAREVTVATTRLALVSWYGHPRTTLPGPERLRALDWLRRPLPRLLSEAADVLDCFVRDVGPLPVERRSPLGGAPAYRHPANWGGYLAAHWDRAVRRAMDGRDDSYVRRALVAVIEGAHEFRTARAWGLV